MKTHRYGPALAIDIRTEIEFASGHLESGSINIPFATALLGDRSLKEEVFDKLRPWRGKPLIIIDKRNKNAPAVSPL